MFVPVVDHEQHPLMPTTPARARRWIRQRKATPFWKGGVWCVRFNQEPSARESQPIAVGIDPGSKKEALVVKSAAHTYLNLQANAVTWVKEAKATQRTMRRARRFRNTPCRQPRPNRLRGRKRLPPSTKARWQWKLRLCRWLTRLFPVSHFVVEDIKAKTWGKRRWDQSFSPLEVGKQWFYTELGRLAPVQTRQGWETQQLRDLLGLKKSRQKLAETFSAHCVDAWVLAWAGVGGPVVPEQTRLLCVTPLQWHRRQLHRLQTRKRRQAQTLWGHAQPGLHTRDTGQAPQGWKGLRRRHAQWVPQLAYPRRWETFMPECQGGSMPKTNDSVLEGAAPPDHLKVMGLRRAKH